MRASVRSEKKASTEGRLRDVGSARNSVAESVAFAMASSGVAILARRASSRVFKDKQMLMDKVVLSKLLSKIWWSWSNEELLSAIAANCRP